MGPTKHDIHSSLKTPASCAPDLYLHTLEDMSSKAARSLETIMRAVVGGWVGRGGARKKPAAVSELRRVIEHRRCSMMVVAQGLFLVKLRRHKAVMRGGP